MKRYDLIYLRFLTLLEGLSLLFLMFVAMPIRWYTKDPSLVKTLGTAHGVLFLMFVYTLFTFAMDEKWKLKRIALAIVASSIPFGAFWFDRKYLR